MKKYKCIKAYGNTILVGEILTEEPHDFETTDLVLRSELGVHCYSPIYFQLVEDSPEVPSVETRSDITLVKIEYIDFGEYTGVSGLDVKDSMVMAAVKNHSFNEFGYPEIISGSLVTIPNDCIVAEKHIVNTDLTDNWFYYGTNNKVDGAYEVYMPLLQTEVTKTPLVAILQPVVSLEEPDLNAPEEYGVTVEVE